MRKSVKILIAHNHYQNFGGEDAVVESELSLLKDFGEDVEVYERSNAEIQAYSWPRKVQHLLDMSWSKKTYQDFRSLIKKFKPEVAHFHNIFFMITPSAYFACQDEGVPVVQSQHNFRLFCSNGLFYRDQRVCEDCLKKTLWQGVIHGCYKHSRLMTMFVSGMLRKHWKEQTWTNRIDLYVTATEFTRQKYIQGGISAEKIVVKPNFVYPDLGSHHRRKGYALYVGRLSQEKGIENLLRAWDFIPQFPLKIIGDGPLGESLKNDVKERNIPNVEFLGFVDVNEKEEMMRGASFIVVPSRCYENFPRIIAEAFSYGIPVVASRLGSLAEIIDEGKTGLLFDPQDPQDLANKIQWMIEHEKEAEHMGRQARKVFEEKYAARKNYEQLRSIYNLAIERRSRNDADAKSLTNS